MKGYLSQYYLVRLDSTSKRKLFFKVFDAIWHGENPNSGSKMNKKI